MPNDRPTLDHGEDDGLVERQIERLKRVEDALANGAQRADDPACHPLYPQAVAARQILAARIEQDRETIRELREAMADAFGTLIYIFETSDDTATSRAAKEAADKLDAALTRKD